MEFLKMALNVDFLLFILGIFWLDIAGYLQEKVATCNPKFFGFVTAALLYIIVSYFRSKNV